MGTKYDIGLEEALSRMLGSLTRLDPVALGVDEVVGLAAAEDCVAMVDCPSASTSLKDGYAVVSADIEDARPDRAVRLKVCGTSVAGGAENLTVKPGQAVKIMTGARIPDGADAVIASEFTTEQGDSVLCFRDARPGRNVLERGFDVTRGERIVSGGRILTPAMTGLLAAGGLSNVSVHPEPRIGIIATGDEIVIPGRPLKPGQLYASNLVTLLSWLRHFGMEVEVELAGDRIEDISRTVEDMFERVDVLLTSGGAWKSDRDLTVRVFEDMGGEVIFHRVRIGPGKAVALILVDAKTVFCLPGGPPSNEMAFLQIALPGLFHLAGREPEPFERIMAILTETVRGQKDWTQFLYATLEENARQLFVSPLKKGSRLRSQANAEALIKIPEGLEQLQENEQIRVQVLFGGAAFH
ncbi:MAG: molybdopterin molybdotransferase MoeA [Planctomycetota bacterium]|jgi:molybdopterin molybdotransferase